MQRPNEDDEFTDAFNLFEEHGYLWDEFLVQRIPYSSLSNAPAPVIADVLVSHPAWKIEKTYTADSGESWLMELEADLRNGTFGPKIGRRFITSSNISEWVSVSSHPAGSRAFRVHADSGTHFGVEANTDAELIEKIEIELRQRNS